MDELNQTQTPPAPQDVKPEQDVPLPPVEALPGASLNLKSPPQAQLQPAMEGAVVPHHGHWALVAVVVFLLVSFFMAWLYLGKMDFKLGSVLETKTPSADEKQAQQDEQLEKEAGNLDLGDLDSEFQAIDQDLNSL